jgi:hypothetical protein
MSALVVDFLLHQPSRDCYTRALRYADFHRVVHRKNWGFVMAFVRQRRCRKAGSRTEIVEYEFAVGIGTIQ